MKYNMEEICRNCGLTFGSHRNGDNYCSKQEESMDRENGPGTRFKPAGTHKKEKSK